MKKNKKISSYNNNGDKLTEKWVTIQPLQSRKVKVNSKTNSSAPKNSVKKSQFKNKNKKQNSNIIKNSVTQINAGKSAKGDTKKTNKKSSRNFKIKGSSSSSYKKIGKNNAPFNVSNKNSRKDIASTVAAIEDANNNYADSLEKAKNTKEWKKVVLEINSRIAEDTVTDLNGIFSDAIHKLLKPYVTSRIRWLEAYAALPEWAFADFDVVKSEISSQITILKQLLMKEYDIKSLQAFKYLFMPVVMFTFSKPILNFEPGLKLSSLILKTKYEPNYIELDQLNGKNKEYPNCDIYPVLPPLFFTPKFIDKWARVLAVSSDTLRHILLGSSESDRDDRGKLFVIKSIKYGDKVEYNSIPIIMDEDNLPNFPHATKFYKDIYADILSVTATIQKTSALKTTSANAERIHGLHIAKFILSQIYNVYGAVLASNNGMLINIIKDILMQSVNSFNPMDPRVFLLTLFSMSKNLVSDSLLRAKEVLSTYSYTMFPNLYKNIMSVFKPYVKEIINKQIKHYAGALELTPPSSLIRALPLLAMPFTHKFFTDDTYYATSSKYPDIEKFAENSAVLNNFIVDTNINSTYIPNFEVPIDSVFANYLAEITNNSKSNFALKEYFSNDKHTTKAVTYGGPVAVYSLSNFADSQPTLLTRVQMIKKDGTLGNTLTDSVDTLYSALLEDHNMSFNWFVMSTLVTYLKTTSSIQRANINRFIKECGLSFDRFSDPIKSNHGKASGNYALLDKFFTSALQFTKIVYPALNTKFGLFHTKKQFFNIHGEQRKLGFISKWASSSSQDVWTKGDLTLSIDNPYDLGYITRENLINNYFKDNYSLYISQDQIYDADDDLPSLYTTVKDTNALNLFRVNVPELYLNASVNKTPTSVVTTVTTMTLWRLLTLDDFKGKTYLYNKFVVDDHKYTIISVLKDQISVNKEDLKYTSAYVLGNNKSSVQNTYVSNPVVYTTWDEFKKYTGLNIDMSLENFKGLFGLNNFLKLFNLPQICAYTNSPERIFFLTNRATVQSVLVPVNKVPALVFDITRKVIDYDA